MIKLIHDSTAVVRVYSNLRTKALVMRTAKLAVIYENGRLA